MFQRLVSLLLIPSLLLSLWASQRHSHGVNEPPDHDSHSHIHLGSLSFFGKHHHAEDTHEADSDKRHHDDDDQDEDTSESDTPINSHDDDAVYFPPSFNLGWRPQSFDGGSGSFKMFTPPLLEMAGTAVILPRLLPTLTHAPPHSLCHGCPINLRTLPLLI